jgi:hypothetical protein
MLVYYTHILRRLINSTDREENHWGSDQHMRICKTEKKWKF